MENSGVEHTEPAGTPPRLTRRRFVERAAALGIAVPGVASLTVVRDARNVAAMAQEATPAAVGPGVSTIQGPDGLTIHIHTSDEPSLFVNGYLVESPNGVVAIDSALTVSGSRSFRAAFDAIGKPLLAVLLTHPHPDHVTGISYLVDGFDVPIVGLASVVRLGQSWEAEVKPLGVAFFGEDANLEPWALPNQLLTDGESVTFDGVGYRVLDFGQGGDCPANSTWVVGTSTPLAFVGDLFYHGYHPWLLDDNVAAWLANLDVALERLAGVETLFPGHGAPAGPDQFLVQRDYLLTYVGAVKRLAGGAPALGDAARAELSARMTDAFPEYDLTYLVAMGADPVAAQLAAVYSERVPG